MDRTYCVNITEVYYIQKHENHLKLHCTQWLNQSPVVKYSVIVLFRFTDLVVILVKIKSKTDFLFLRKVILCLLFRSNQPIPVRLEFLTFSHAKMMQFSFIFGVCANGKRKGCYNSRSVTTSDSTTSGVLNT